MDSVKNNGRIAGFLYLLVIICGGFSEMYVRDSIIEAGDATTTAANILASEGLFRIGIISDLFMVMFYMFLGLALYVMLKSVNRTYALIMLTVNCMGVPIMALNMLNQFAAIQVLGGSSYLNVFDADQLNALAMLFLDLHTYGYILAAVSYGTWLFPLGYLFYKSGYFPKILGIFLMIASVTYLIEFIVQFLLPEYAETVSTVILAPSAIAEVSVCIWLLVKGAKS